MVPILKYTVESLPNFVRKLNSQGLECSQLEARLRMFSVRSKACRVSDERKYEPAGGRIFRLSVQFFSSNPTQQICDNKYLPLFFNLHKNYIYCLNNLFLLL
jgi:hypothetical protein